MFAHAETAGSGVLKFPDLPFEWDRSSNMHALTVFTDENLVEVSEIQSAKKVAWLYESPEVTKKCYKKVHREAERFDRILTFYKPLLESHPHARFTPIGGCWLHECDWGIHPKTKNLSVIASSKKSLPGHKLRHQVIGEHRGKIDFIAGSGYSPILLKKEALHAFRYSLSIENCREDYYFTEKLIDCFLSGTVPIYWGCPSIGLFFNREGMITFKHPRELEKLLSTLGSEDYNRRLPAIRENFERAMRYVYVEQHVWNYIHPLLSC